MKIRELRQKSDKELGDLLIGKQQKLGQLRFDLASKKLKNVREMREIKKDIAKIFTLLSEPRIKNQGEL